MTEPHSVSARGAKNWGQLLLLGLESVRIASEK